MGKKLRFSQKKEIYNGATIGYATRLEAEAAKAARGDGNCFYVYQMSDGYWALGRYAGRATASGYAGL